MAPLGEHVWPTALHVERVWLTALLGERVSLKALHVGHSCAGLVWQTAPLAACGRAGHVWEMAPVAGRRCDVPAMVSLERQSWVELQGI